MTLNELYNIADESDIDVDYFPMKQVTSLSTPYGIALDVDKINSSYEEKVCLAHELGHCKLNAFYNIFSKFDSKSKQEYKADCWAVNKLIPPEELKEAFENGYTNLWELSELFDVPEQFVIKAIEIYKRKCLL